MNHCHCQRCTATLIVAQPSHSRALNTRSVTQLTRWWRHESLLITSRRCHRTLMHSSDHRCHFDAIISDQYHTCLPLTHTHAHTCISVTACKTTTRHSASSVRLMHIESNTAIISLTPLTFECHSSSLGFMTTGVDRSHLILCSFLMSLCIPSVFQGTKIDQLCRH